MPSDPVRLREKSCVCGTCPGRSVEAIFNLEPATVVTGLMVGWCWEYQRFVMGSDKLVLGAEFLKLWKGLP